MSNWLPLKDAPKDGSLVFVFHKEWDEPQLLIWKFNPRIGKWYFGIPSEYDDCDLAYGDMSEAVFLPYKLPE